MAKTYNKKQLLKIFTETLTEYENRRHSAIPKHCGLCQTFKRNMDGFRILDVGEHSCMDCPMFAFYKADCNGDSFGYPCVDRLCKPVHCCHDMDSEDLTRLNMVTVFYRKLVEVVEKIETEEIDRELLSETLRKLDFEVFDDIHNGDFNDWIGGIEKQK